MNLLYTVLTWIINLACVYVAYLAVREVEKTVVRRTFSLLLTLVLVIGASALLIGGVGIVSTVFLQFLLSSYSVSSDSWVAVVGAILALGIVALIGRDVAARSQGETCPQCGTPLQGKVVCPQCGWGGLRPPESMAEVAQQFAARASAAQNRPTSQSTPTVREIPPAPAVTAGAIPDTVCPKCGTANTSGATFCANCGASLT